MIRCSECKEEQLQLSVAHGKNASEGETQVVLKTYAKPNGSEFGASVSHSGTAATAVDPA